MIPSEANTRFRQAFDDHFDAVSRYCLRRLPHADAKDATAQTFAVAWRKVDQMPAAAETLPWLYRIAFYEVKTIRRSSNRYNALRARVAGQADGQVDPPDTVVEERDLHRILMAALSTLSEADQEVILLRSQEELSTADLASVLECNVEAARKRLSRALSRLSRAAGIGAEPITAGQGGRT